MPEFFQSCACRGSRPRHLASIPHIARPQLTSRMLRERMVPRCIVAPDGFGKTGLALDYADTVFSFEHTFWVDATSPCFLRDLDKRDIKKSLDLLDTHPYLVVFEDVPTLDAQRSLLFCDEVNDLLDAGDEVLITCSPSSDSFEKLHDRILLNSSDLLLSDREVSGLSHVSGLDGQAFGDRFNDGQKDVSPSQRVAALAWGGRAAREKFMEGIFRENPPQDIKLLIFVMLLLGSGSVEDVRHFVPCPDETFGKLERDYPYLGIDSRQGLFTTGAFTLPEIARVYAKHLSDLAKVSCFKDVETFLERMGDALCAKGLCERACETLRLFALASTRASWLESHSDVLIEQLCLAAACDLYRSLSHDKAVVNAPLKLQQAFRLWLLGERRLAEDLSRQLADDNAADLAIRFQASLLTLASSPSDQTTDILRLNRLYEAMVYQHNYLLNHPLESNSSTDQYAKLIERWARALDVLNTSGDDGERAGEWERAVVAASDSEREGLVLIASVVITSIKVDGATGSFFELLQAAFNHALSERALATSDAAYKTCLYYVGCCVEQTCAPDGSSSMAFDRLPTIRLRVFDRQLSDEQKRFNAAARVQQNPSVFEGAQFAQNDTVDKSLMRKESVPKLKVNLFGGMSIFLGSQCVGDDAFGRKKAKTLLALLVINRGREISRERLASLLWPDSEIRAARKNLYAVWSSLRRALTLSDGTCPYLERHQDSVRINRKLLKTDVDDLDEVCRALMFESASFGGWGRVYQLVTTKFSDEFMPSEDACLAVIGYRNLCRDRLVDALVAAAYRIAKAGNPQESLWFARAALERDRTREDVYTALMRAQLASNQRTAALATYFECRKYLAEELGIDPSVETMNLYRSIIETEMAF